MINRDQKNICIYSDDYPSTLDKSELLDPYLVIDSFFCTYSLRRAKDYLWQSVKFNLVDINKPSVGMRPVFYRFLLDLERLIDAAWLMNEYTLTKKIAWPNYLSKDTLKKWRDEDLISFLSPYDSEHPTKAIKDFFSYQSLCRWKVSYLENLRKTILEPMYFLLFGSDTLEEFVKFTMFCKLLEGLFLMRVQKNYESNYHTEPDLGNWNDSNHADVNEWLSEYRNQNQSFISVQHFANICYAHRFHHEWNNYNVHKIFESYEVVQKVTHAATHILNNLPISSLPISIQQIVKHHKIWSTGRVTRFLTRLLLTSRTFSKGYKAYVTPQKEMDFITQLIYIAHEIPKI